MKGFKRKIENPQATESTLRKSSLLQNIKLKSSGFRVKDVDLPSGMTISMERRRVVENCV